ncbi:MAG: hypothetical protein LN561_06505 [Rickettsia endosymbiont of Labidopullus appendiculatus]|nr:hypothetical protein [Rickettsia endosymbiont of Labidopullus appendiculatus]
MDSRLFPVKQGFFENEIEPIIEKNYIWKGRPPKISHYKVFCAIMYVLRIGIGGFTKMLWMLATHLPML